MIQNARSKRGVEKDADSDHLIEIAPIMVK